MVHEDYLRCSDYENGQAHATETGFATFYHEESQRHFFVLYDGLGKVLLKSEGYPQQAARENGILSVVKNRGNEDFYSVKTYENGRSYISLRAANYREIARSCSFETEGEAVAELPYIMGVRSRLEEAVVVATDDKERANNKVDDDYMACKEYAGQGDADENGMVKFSHSNGKHYFVWLDADGDVLMRSEGYPTTAARDNGYNSVLKNRDNEDRYGTVERMGRYFVTLKAGNHQEIARSCPYDSEAAAWAIYPTARANRSRTSIVTEVVESTTSAESITTITTGETIVTEGTATTTEGISESTTIAASAAAIAAISTTETTSETTKIELENVEKTTLETQVIESVAPTVTNTTIVTETVQRVVVDVEDDYLPCREYQGHNVTDILNNISTFKHDNGQYYFVVYSANGGVRLRSEGFNTEEERASELAAVIKHLENDAMYETITRGDYYIKVLKDETGREIGRSCLQKDEIEVIPPVVEAAPVVAAAAIAAAVVEPPKVEAEPDVEDDYLPCKDYEGRTVNDKVNNVALFKHENGQYYFAIYHKDGKVRLRSEGFRTAQDRDKELSGALKGLNNPELYSTIRRGNYFMQVLKDTKGREVGRSCLEKDEPAIPVAPVAVAAAAAAVAAAIPAVEVEKPKPVVVDVPKMVAETPVVNEVVEEAASGFNWWWLLLPLLALLAWWFLKDGCNKPEVKVPDVTVVTPPVDTVKAVTPPPVAGCPSCTGSSSDPIFTSVCDNPKKLSRLGTNPEFGDSHGLSTSEFYAKLKKAHTNNDVDKEFLDRVYKAMGYANGFADAKADQITEVILPQGTSGRLGYSKAHKTGCYTLPDAEYHRKAFRLEASNGCHLHIMKTCGNHFFFCAQ